MHSSIPNQFIDIRYDSRNKQQAGQNRGVGQRGKVGLKYSKDMNAFEESKKGSVYGVPPLKYN